VPLRALPLSASGPSGLGHLKSDRKKGSLIGIDQSSEPY